MMGELTRTGITDGLTLTQVTGTTIVDIEPQSRTDFASLQGMRACRQPVPVMSTASLCKENAFNDSLDSTSYWVSLMKLEVPASSLTIAFK